MVVFGMIDPRFMDHLDIVFTKHDVEGLQFPHDDAFFMQLKIV